MKVERNPRGWLRFSMRSLLVVMLIAACFCAWLGKPILRAATQRPIVHKVTAVGGTVGYDFQINAGINSIDLSRTPTGSRLVRSILGDDIFATVQVVHLPDASDADVAELHKLTDLLDVSLWGDGVTDDCVDKLLRIGELRSLSLGNTSITPEGLRRLASCKSIVSLSLVGGSIGDEHVHQLPAFPSLQHLVLTRTSVADDGLASIGTITDLISLAIYSATGVSDEGFSHLENLRKLAELRVLEVPLSDSALETIAELNQMRYLHLRGLPFTDSGFRLLAELRELEEAHLSGTQLGDEGLRALTKDTKRLRYLDLSGTMVTDDGISGVATLPNLEHLHLGNTAVSGSGLLLLSGVPSLKSIHVGLSDHMTIESVEALKRVIPTCVIECWEYFPDGSGYHIATK